MTVTPDDGPLRLSSRVTATTPLLRDSGGRQHTLEGRYDSVAVTTVAVTRKGGQGGGDKVFRKRICFFGGGIDQPSRRLAGVGKVWRVWRVWLG